MAKKYYVVWKGAKTGVFDAWSTVQALTAGRSDAQFMGFVSKAEAEQAFQSTYTKALMKRSLTKDSSPSTSTSKSRATATSPVSASPNAQAADVQIYCDGACSPNPGKSGTGVAIYQQGKVSQLWYGAYDANGTNNTAELIGLLKSFAFAKQLIAQKQSVQILSDSKYSIDSITKWATGWKKKGWKKANGEVIKNPELVQQCFALYQEIKNQITITHVKGHANIEGNELSDRMAVLARTSREAGFIQYDKVINISEILAMPSG